MSLEFDGPRTAIVTGGARRIGAALARALGEDGWHLLIHCNRSIAQAEALAEELGNARVVAADLADPGAAGTIFGAAAGLPPVRLLVNNASQFEYDSADDFPSSDGTGTRRSTSGLRPCCRRPSRPPPEARGE
jgi:NAD(P)-dependent dehydrogenase (short-subunit alcohol dehydrogenase family)